MTHDEVHRLLLRRIRAWRNEDLGAIMADYGDDIVHVSPYGTRVGVADRRAANARYLAEYTGFEVQLHRLVVEGDQGALEWTWTETRRADGLRRSADDAIVFVLRDGKITPRPCRSARSARAREVRQQGRRAGRRPTNCAQERILIT